MMIGKLLYDETYISDVVSGLLIDHGFQETPENIEMGRNYLLRTNYLRHVALAAMKKLEPIPGIIYNFHKAKRSVV